MQEFAKIKYRQINDATFIFNNSNDQVGGDLWPSLCGWIDFFVVQSDHTFYCGRRWSVIYSTRFVSKMTNSGSKDIVDTEKKERSLTK